MMIQNLILYLRRLRPVAIYGYLEIHQYIGAISFAPGFAISVISGMSGLAIGDIDNDGKPEIAVTPGFGSLVAVLRNTSSVGNISFAPGVRFFSS